MRNLLVIVLMVAAVAFAYLPAPVDAANNFVQEGQVLNITWSSTSPSSGEPVVKGTLVASGGITGVALDGTATANETVHVQTQGVFTLPVRAISTPIAIGDTIYTTIAGINSSVASLTNVNTGLAFGTALEALVTASNTQNIKVLLRHP